MLQSNRPVSTTMNSAFSVTRTAGATFGVSSEIANGPRVSDLCDSQCFHDEIIGASAVAIEKELIPEPCHS